MLSPDHDHLPLLLPEDDVVRGGLITVAWLLLLLIFTPRITNTEEGVILLRQQTGQRPPALQPASTGGTSLPGL